LRARARHPAAGLVNTLGWSCFALLSLALCAGMAFLGATMRPYPLAGPTAPQPTVVYSSDGAVLAKLYEGQTIPVTLSQVPAHVVHAILAAEDRRFYRHRGLDWRGTLRAAWINLRAGEIRQGGSTITQQLARVALLDDRRTWPRKIKELVLAVRIERAHSKSEILERYVNTVYFGGGAYGIGAAARGYFHKPVEQLSPAEGALLAGLIREPSGGSPRVNLPTALRRQREVLAAMVELGWLTRTDYRHAVHAPLEIYPWERPAWRAPYVVETVRQELRRRYGERMVYRGGLTVITSIDSTYQREAEAALADAVRQGRRLGVGNGALVAIEPHTGFIRALVGGTDFSASQFNRATQAHRQPGSAFKAFVYQAALERGHILDDSEIDAPITIGGWSPRNYGERYHGRVTLRRALALSLNSVAVRLTKRLSPFAVLAAAREAGIDSGLRPTLSIALGSYDVTPLEMARAFATYANGGRQTRPILIREIHDGGALLFRAQLVARRTVEPEIAAMLTEGLRGVITGGTGRRADIGRPAAGKTGTTNDFRDAWFVGYTPFLSTAVWLGNDQRRPMRGVAGGTLPAQAWAQFMRAAHRGLPAADFPIPPGMMAVTLCSLTGVQALPSCPHPVETYLSAARLPTEFCPIHYFVPRTLCAESGGLATPRCPRPVTGYDPYTAPAPAPCPLPHRAPVLRPTPTRPVTTPYFPLPEPPDMDDAPTYAKPPPKTKPPAAIQPPTPPTVPYRDLPPAANGEPEEKEPPPDADAPAEPAPPRPPAVSLD